jgi:hypothetical protein
MRESVPRVPEPKRGVRSKWYSSGQVHFIAMDRAIITEYTEGIKAQAGRFRSQFCWSISLPGYKFYIGGDYTHKDFLCSYGNNLMRR